MMYRDITGRVVDIDSTTIVVRLAFAIAVSKTTWHLADVLIDRDTIARLEIVSSYCHLMFGNIPDSL